MNPTSDRPASDHRDQHVAVDVVVIGAGVIGCALALELSRRGYRTLNLDKGPAAGAGSTSNSCAIVRFTYSTIPGVTFAWEGGHYWRNWVEYIGVDDELGLIEFRQTGQLVFLADGGNHSARVKELWDQLDIPHEVLTTTDLATRYPYIDLGLYGPPTRPEDPAFWKDATGSITGALFSPHAGYVSDPQRACHNLQRGAEAHGARFRFGAEVTGIDRDDRRVRGVTMSTGETIEAPIVVNVAGPHSSVINEMAGVYDSMNIKTAALRHEVHHVPAPDGVDFMAAGVVAADDDLGFYFRPEVGNNVLLGSVDAPCDPRDFVDPDAYDTAIDRDQWNTQALRAGRRMPGMGLPHEMRGVVDLYDVSDDWLPIYDRTDLDGFYVAIGTSGNQFKNAGVAGQAMADLIDAVESGHDHDAEPFCTTGRYTGREIDMGAYSRNREVTADSSMSVHG